MTKKKEREYAKDRQEYFREFHRVIAPVVVMKKYDELTTDTTIVLFDHVWHSTSDTTSTGL